MRELTRRCSKCALHLFKHSYEEGRVKNNSFYYLNQFTSTLETSQGPHDISCPPLASCMIFNTDSQIQGNTKLFIPFVQKSAHHLTHSGVTEGACTKRHAFVNTHSGVTEGVRIKRHTFFRDSKRANFACPYSSTRQSEHKYRVSARTLFVHKSDHRTICTG